MSDSEYVDEMNAANLAVQCFATAASCRCRVIGEHVAHECLCGGKWLGTYEGDDFEVLVLPPIWPVKP